VDLARRRKEEVALFEGLAAAGANVFAAALNYYINFIPSVRLLGIDFLRRIDFNFQRAVSKDGGKCLTLRPREITKCLVYSDPPLWRLGSLDWLRCTRCIRTVWHIVSSTPLRRDQSRIRLMGLL